MKKHFIERGKMEFGFTEQQMILRDSVKGFMEKECPPGYVRELDAKEQFPYELYSKMEKMGWFGLPFPEAYGGSGLGAVDFVIVGEEMSRHSFEIAAGYGISLFCGLNIIEHGSEEQIKHYIPKIINNEIRLSIAITEPNAGSDAASLMTSAVLDGEEWVINGQKTFQTASDADNNIMSVFVRTDKSLPKHKGISMILVPKDTPGVEMRRISTIGRKILHTNEVFFEDVRVPKKNLVGEVNKGWNILLSGLELERLFGCASYIGCSQTVVDIALKHAKEREQFGRPIGSFQAIGHMLADMQTDVDAARMLTYRAAWMYDNNTPCMKEVSMAKLFGSEMYARLSNQGMQIMGGYGYTTEYDMQRHFRDSRIITVSAGSSQMQRTTIARGMGLNVV
ncbi:MAG: acyl-CoA dehydrogenase family protein [Desulfatiglans sp.]|nr:acyl-CoA dehydrogenase family protein [Thermodesulfobacteriota bacterium]MEE4353960.1 acyl-CoA dehydrogenase family protein [Desulfatiglans sp.]